MKKTPESSHFWHENLQASGLYANVMKRSSTFDNDSIQKHIIKSRKDWLHQKEIKVLVLFESRYH